MLDGRRTVPEHVITGAYSVIFLDYKAYMVLGMARRMYGTNRGAFNMEFLSVDNGPL